MKLPPASGVSLAMDAIRWSSVPYCLAALALASPSIRRTHAVAVDPALELAAPAEIVVSEQLTQSDDSPPPEPLPHRRWTGPCAQRSALWNVPLEIALDVTPADGGLAEPLVITGKLEFAGRHAALTTAEGIVLLPEQPGVRSLTGDMTEIGGGGTSWEVFLDIDRVDSRHLVGSLVEIGGDRSTNVICHFDWRR